MIALRWPAMPSPCRRFEAASASARLTTRIFSASPFEAAATCSRACAWMSFIAATTCEAGVMSMTRQETMMMPYCPIAGPTCCWIATEMSSLRSNTWSRSMVGTCERTESSA